MSAGIRASELLMQTRARCGPVQQRFACGPVRDNASLTGLLHRGRFAPDLRRRCFADFAALWLLIHASGSALRAAGRLCIERWREPQKGRKVSAARDKLRDGRVEDAL